MSYCVPVFQPVFLRAHPASDGLWLSWEAAPLLFSVCGCYHCPFSFLLVDILIISSFGLWHTVLLEHYWVLSCVQIFKDPEGRVFDLGFVDTLDLMFLASPQSHRWDKVSFGLGGAILVYNVSLRYSGVESWSGHKCVYRLVLATVLKCLTS